MSYIFEVLDRGDRAALLLDLQRALAESSPENLAPLQKVLGEWATTAAQLSDRQRATVLLSETHNPDDFVQVAGLGEVTI